MAKGSCANGSGEPAVENGELVRRDTFVKADAHAETRAHVNDAPEKIELFALVVEFDADHGAGRGWIQSVNVAAGSADVAGARGKASAGIHFNNFHGENQWHTLSVAAILHGAWHSESLFVPSERFEKEFAV